MNLYQKDATVPIMNTQNTFYLLIGLLCSTLNGTTSDAKDASQLLSPEKQVLLRHQQEQNDAEHAKLRTNWIAPLNLTGTYSNDKSAAADSRSTTKRLGASITQDVFRSGGITYQIGYADAKNDASRIALEQQVSNLNLQLFTALLGYRKNSYEIDQSAARLANYDIEIFIRRHLYEAGKNDITQLNTSLMDKSTELKNASSLRYARAQQRLEIAKLSDIDPETYTPPVFTLTARNDYLAENLELRYAKAQNRTYTLLSDVTRTAYLPTASLSGSTGYQNTDPGNSGGAYDGGYYSAAVNLNVPLSYNGTFASQEAKAAALKQSADTADRERLAKAAYEQSIELIENYRRTIEIAQSNLALYNDLIAAIQAGVDAGTKTGYDLQTLQNTRSIEENTIRINEINIQIELAKLHFTTSKELP